MKSIYTKIGDKYYKVNQETTIPAVLNKLVQVLQLLLRLMVIMDI